MNFDRKNLTDDSLLDLYKRILKPRLIERKCILSVKEKYLNGFRNWPRSYLSRVTAVLDKDEYILPMHRNPVFLRVGYSITSLISNGKRKSECFTKGRDRSFHFGTQEYKIIGMISHLGPQLGVADGIALANKLKKNGKLPLFYRRRATSEGDFHEAYCFGMGIACYVR
jgi:2-oxoisovalerate dehydrogenase E1 component